MGVRSFSVEVAAEPSARTDRRRIQNGYCDFSSDRIGIRPDKEPLQAVKTLVQELAHALLHANDVSVDRPRQEVEVESVAFVVLDAIGLSSDGYSFPYVARWAGGDMETIRETGERVVTCAGVMLEGLAAEKMNT